MQSSRAQEDKVPVCPHGHGGLVGGFQTGGRWSRGMWRGKSGGLRAEGQGEEEQRRRRRRAGQRKEKTRESWLGNPEGAWSPVQPEGSG